MVLYVMKSLRMAFEAGKSKQYWQISDQMVHTKLVAPSLKNYYQILRQEWQDLGSLRVPSKQSKILFNSLL